MDKMPKCKLCNADTPRDGCWFRHETGHFCSQMCMSYALYPTKDKYLESLKPKFDDYGPPIEKKNWNVLNRAIFDPYFDRALGRDITSYRHQEKAINEHNRMERDTKLYPRTFGLWNDHHRDVREAKYVARHKEEWKKAHYSGYKPGERVYNPDRPDIKRSGRTKYVFFGKT